MCTVLGHVKYLRDAREMGCLFLHVYSGAAPLASGRYRSEIAEAAQLINKERETGRDMEKSGSADG